MTDKELYTNIEKWLKSINNMEVVMEIHSLVEQRILQLDPYALHPSSVTAYTPNTTAYTPNTTTLASHAVKDWSSASRYDVQSLYSAKAWVNKESGTCTFIDCTSTTEEEDK